jgi:hypothetical protein
LLGARIYNRVFLSDSPRLQSNYGGQILHSRGLQTEDAEFSLGVCSKKEKNGENIHGSEVSTAKEMATKTDMENSMK